MNNGRIYICKTKFLFDKYDFLCYIIIKIFLSFFFFFSFVSVC